MSDVSFGRFKNQHPFPVLLQVSLDQYHTEEEIYQISLQREPRKPVVSCTLMFAVFPLPLYECPLSVSDLPALLPSPCDGLSWYEVYSLPDFVKLPGIKCRQIKDVPCDSTCDSDTLLLWNNWSRWETPFMQWCVVKSWVDIGNLWFFFSIGIWVLSHHGLFSILQLPSLRNMTGSASPRWYWYCGLGFLMRCSRTPALPPCLTPSQPWSMSGLCLWSPTLTRPLSENT